MSLIICNECGNEFSDKAPACPKCGCPIEFAKPKSNSPHTSSGKKIEKDIKNKILEFENAIAEGIDLEDAKNIVLHGNNEFYQVLGSLDICAGPIVVMSTMKHIDPGQTNINEDAYKHEWDKFTKAQQECTDFFGDGVMRHWIIARSIKKQSDEIKWNLIEQMMNNGDGYWDYFRDEAWWRVPWSFAVAQDIEKQYGAAECNSERFQKLFRQRGNIVSFIKSLSQEQVDFYRCTD